jgi:hypothetical protein
MTDVFFDGEPTKFATLLKHDLTMAMSFSPKILTKSFSLAFFKSLTDKGRFAHLAGSLYEQNIFIRSTVRDELKNS